jgi:PAS domain S-box-containing protein
MFAFGLQSLTSLLLAGILVYAICTWDLLRNRLHLQQILLGVVLGIAVISLGISNILVESYATSFDARAGPLVFAGYLGGAIGGLIAGLFGASYWLMFDGPEPVIGTLMNLGVPMVGVVVALFLRPENWQLTRVSAIGFLMLGFTALHIPPFVYLASTSEAPHPYRALLWDGTGHVASGLLSILVTWQILRYACRLANNTNQAGALSRNLELAKQTSGIGMYVYEAGDTGSYFDAELLAMLGMGGPARIVERAEWEAVCHPDDLGQMRQDMMHALESGNLRGKSEFRAVRSDGTTRYIRTTWVAELDGYGRFQLITGMNIDLTDIQEAEKLTLSSLGRVASVAQQLPGAIVEFDATVRDKPEMLYISPKCAEIWGYSDDELYADPELLFHMHDPTDVGNFLRAVHKSNAAGESLYHRYKITARDGQTRWLDYYGEPVRENGRIIVKSIVLDATREVVLQQRMEEEHEISRRAQKNESLGQLTGGVAHDFNNLLAVILGNLELLREEDDRAAQNDLIAAASTAVLRGADLTKNMLAFARQAPLIPVVLDLNEVIGEAKNWIARTLPESVVVETILFDGLWPIEADRASLESALLNLTLNARDAMEGHGNLTVETANLRVDEMYGADGQEKLTVGRYVMLSVTDDGTGILPQVIGTIFEPFFTTKAPGLGSGLGLSMTLGFMRQSGGTVHVETEVGKGTTFRLYFPAVSRRNTQPEKVHKTTSRGAGSGKRILLAEDEEAVRATLVTTLERAGYQVTEAATGDVAFATFEADPTFDLLLSDVVMPGTLQGPDLANALRERWPDLPVLFLSGYAGDATATENGMRADDIRLMKPVRRSDLLAAVVRAMAPA